jgi:hypothetical protein
LNLEEVVDVDVDDRALRLFVDDVNRHLSIFSDDPATSSNKHITVEEIVTKFNLAASIRDVLDDG